MEVVRVVQQSSMTSKHHVVSIRRLATAIGNRCYVSNLLQVWHVFMASLHAHFLSPEGCPRGCGCTTLILPSLKMFQTFLCAPGGFVDMDLQVRGYVSMDIFD